MKDVIKLENVSKYYQLDKVQVEALKDVNLDIERGEFLAITGASGSGKSTLLHLIGCLDLPTHGKIYLNGTDIGKLSSGNLARLRGKTIGFVFQFFNLYPTLTAKGNVELPMIIVETDKKEREERSIRLLEKVGLGDRIDHYPSQLSGGQRQRVAVARALANNPSLLLADEPTGNLDSKSGQEIMQLFKELNKDGMTVIVVTHDNNISNHAKKKIHVKDGQILKNRAL
jgi:putative ABC transport system ATP-binding protein